MRKAPLVFVVDDEPMVRKALQRSIESLQVDVVAFPSAELCLDALKDETCDLVITDMNLSGVSGISLLQQIKATSPLINVMLISGFGSIGNAVKSLQLGAIDFIEKPLDEEVILPKIKAVLEKMSLPEGSEMLSSVEETVLKSIGEGLTNKEIAFKIGKSTRSVENYRHRLTKKLGASSTADLVRIALSRMNPGV